MTDDNTPVAPTEPVQAEPKRVPEAEPIPAHPTGVIVPDDEIQHPDGSVTEEDEIDEEYDEDSFTHEAPIELPEQIEPADEPNGGE